MRNIRFKIGTCLITTGLCLATLAVPMEGYCEQAWDMVNGQYVDASGTPIAGALEKGITVTKYQNRQNADKGGIDWKKVANDGISFAMVRIGYFEDRDPYYSLNMTNAAENGLQTGVFFYSQALDTQSAAEEASYVLRMVKDYKVSYPIAYDIESQYILDNHLSKQQITDNVNAFCKIIADAGYYPMVYTNHKWLTNHIDMKQIPYDVWYARYGSINNCQNRTIWQCTDKGRVNGIDGDVTIEFSFADYGSLIPSEGWKHIDGNWYYTRDYIKQTGWIQVNGIWYYLDSNGILIHDTTMDIDGVPYTFGSNGALLED